VDRSCGLARLSQLERWLGNKDSNAEEQFQKLLCCQLENDDEAPPPLYSSHLQEFLGDFGAVISTQWCSELDEWLDQDHPHMATDR
jgi:hypothetical protein